MLHHDAITGTHSLTAKRDYDDKINKVNNIISNTNQLIIQDIDHLYKGTYGTTKLEEVASKLL